MSEPRAKTPEEIRDDFMDTCRRIADYWADPDLVKDHSCAERISGALHSWLCLIDGVTAGMPGFDLAAHVHPDDKEYHRSEGENWIEPGTVINAEDMLHEMLYHRGAWAGRP